MHFKHPVHAEGKLQARCRPSRNLTIGVKSHQCKKKKKYFFKSALFFLFRATSKTKPVPGSSLENFKIGGVPKLKKIIFMEKKWFFYEMTWENEVN